jgi:rhomboid family GlyGly-CTERM serine protease
VIATLILTLLAAAAALVDGSALELQRGGAAWRAFTCHLTHWTYEQLAWDGLVFLGLGLASARKDSAAVHATLLASAIAVPCAVLLFAPEVIAYRGLSGIDSALFALVLVMHARNNPAVVLCAAGFALKIAFEMTTGATVFVSGLGPGVQPVPVAHVAGATVGLLIGLATMPSCAPSSSPA